MIELYHVSALLICQEEWRAGRVSCFGTLVCQIGFGFACVHLASYFCLRTQGRGKVSRSEAGGGGTEAQEIGLSFPREFIPQAQAIPKISLC